MNPKKFSHAFLAFFSLLAVFTMTWILCKWFGGTVSDLNVPGWGWGRFFTGFFLAGGGAAVVMWICYGAFACPLFFDQKEYAGERIAAETILDAFSGLATIGFFPSLLWWGLYLA